MGACELDIIIPISAKVKRRRGEEGKAGEMAHVMETRAKHVWEKRENTLTWALRPLKYHTIVNNLTVDDDNKAT